MPHLLFGYRQRAGKITVEPSEAAIVRAILNAKRGSPVTLARLTPSDTYKAMACRVARIRRHAPAYRAGCPILGFPPSRALVLTP